MLFALGFVFMFTIGGLINNHLALPLKITICWELLTIILLGFLLNSVTMYNFKNTIILCYSTSFNKVYDTSGLNPLNTYDNLKEDRPSILKEQKDMSGVY